MKAKSFTFLGLTFKPLLKLKGREADCAKITKRISDEKDTPEGWSWAEFYKEARKHDAHQYDLFEVEGSIRFPAGKVLFHYE